MERRTAYLLLMMPALAWCAGFVVAPLLASHAFADVLAQLYVRVCHQLPERSFAWGALPWAVCIRCSSIYLAFTLTILVVPLVRGLDRWRPLSPRVFAAWLVPVVADAVFDFVGLHAAGSVSRIMTGTLAGIGLALTVTPLFLEALTRRRVTPAVTSPGDLHA